MTDDVSDPRRIKHRDHASALFIIAAELKLDSYSTQTRDHAPESVAQLKMFGALGQRTERRSASLTMESSRV
jgi:CRISPR/Cas system CMR-associated protein Cmr1 (group 7 of RAMP superfamily)